LSLQRTGNIGRFRRQSENRLDRNVGIQGVFQANPSNVPRKGSTITTLRDVKGKAEGTCPEIYFGSTRNPEGIKNISVKKKELRKGVLVVAHTRSRV